MLHCVPLAVLVILPATVLAATAGVEPPGNVLLVVADDLGVDMLPCYGVGTDLPDLPVIEGLATQGVRFTAAYASPICSPTRACLQTGRHAFRTGIGTSVMQDDLIVLLPEEITLPEMLTIGAPGTYAHALIGKWHLTSDLVGGFTAPNDAGWSYFEGSLYNLDARGSVDYYDWLKVENGVPGRTTTYATTDTVDATLAWLAAAPEPWVLQLAFNAPHSPWQAPPPGLYSTDLSMAGEPMVDPRPYYKAMTEALDTELGRLLQALDAEILQRTTVIFTADNGTPGPVVAPPIEPNKAKGTVFEGGVRVPMIVTGPLVAEAGSVCDGFVHAVDVFATVADVAGIDLQAALPGVTIDGISLLPYLADPATPSQRPAAFAERFDPNKEGGEAPPAFLCQEDLGFGGPGDALLEVCGAPLYAGNEATVLLQGGPPGATAYVLIGTTDTPTPFAGGSLIPFPWFVLAPLALDEQGALAFPLPGGPYVAGGLPWLTFQGVIPDASQPQGWSLSNSVKARFLPDPFSRRAIRSNAYKLIVRTTEMVDASTVQESLYDLTDDPLEVDGLLLGMLSPTQQQAYDDLRVALDALLASEP